MDKETTISVQKLFQPIFDIRGPFPNNPKKKDDDEYLEITSRRASEWIGERGVRKDVALAAQDDEDVLVNIDQAYKNGRISDTYARLFIWSLYADTLPKRVKSVSKPTAEALDEFEKAIRQKYRKPRAVVPDDVTNEEMNYVNQLLGVYEEASGEPYDNPDDVKGSVYEGHFRQQRKNYYQAELIHREIRDVVRKDKDEGFDILKEEIEDGIYGVSHRHYELGLDKADAVLDYAGSMPISQNTGNNMLGWVGPGEKRGVCHILVNEKRLKWLEDDEHEK